MITVERRAATQALLPSMQASMRSEYERGVRVFSLMIPAQCWQVNECRTASSVSSRVVLMFVHLALALVGLGNGMGASFGMIDIEGRNDAGASARCPDTAFSTLDEMRVH